MKNNVKTITYLAGVARSGTSWLGQIFNSSPKVRFSFQPFFSYEFKNMVNEDSTDEEFKQLFKEIYNANSSFLSQKDKQKSGDYPIFQKTNNSNHLVLKENRYQYMIEPLMRKCTNVQLVAMIRNPNAVLNSWIKNPKEFPAGSIPLKEWRFGACKNKGPEDFFGYYKWKETSNIYLDLQSKWPGRVYVLRYEDLVASTVKTVTNLFDFCKIPFNDQTYDFINKSTNTHIDSPYSVYKNKGVVNQWKQELDSYITNEIKNDLKGTRLEIYLEK
jgi:hypothetical protein